MAHSVPAPTLDYDGRGSRADRIDPRKGINLMELGEAIQRRRMVRNYDPNRPVAREQLDALLALAIRAPSAGFSQGWRFLVLDEPRAVARFWAATSKDDPDEPADRWLVGMRRAPALVIALSDKSIYLDRYAEPDKGWVDRSESHWPVPYWYIDTGMAGLLILLGATDAGLASCLFGVPGERWDALRAEFSISPGLDPVAVISLGYQPAGEPEVRSPSLRRGRRPVAEVAAYNGF
jgi:nitroreductase